MTIEQFGRYEIKREIGRGGMAVVYLAHDPALGRDVALKVLPREFLNDPDFLNRFQREAHTIARLEHQAIVPLYDFGEHEKQPYLIMRHMTGGTLAQRLRAGPMGLEEAARIMERVCGALEKAHSRGVVHRDLKPGNILFDEEGAAYLSDFGIARLMEQTHTMTIIGTPQYMAPEQAHGHPVDARTDVYQMGAVLFSILSGRPPFEADTPPALLHQHAYEPVPSITELAPYLPGDAEVVIRRAMAKQKESRYQSVQALADAVADVAAGRPLVDDAPEETQVAPSLSGETAVGDNARSARYRLYAGLVVLLLLLGVGGAGLVFSLGNGDNADAEAATQTALAAVPSATATPAPSSTATPTVSPTVTSSPSSTPTGTASATSTPRRQQEVRYRVTADSATVYSGPGNIYAQLDMLFGGQTVLVLARTEDGEWLNVELDDGTRAWLLAADGEPVEPDTVAAIPTAVTVPASPTRAPATLAPASTSTPTPFSDRDGDGFADSEDDCPDEYGVSERGGCPFPGPSTDTPVPYP